VIFFRRECFWTAIAPL